MFDSESDHSGDLLMRNKSDEELPEGSSAGYMLGNYYCLEVWNPLFVDLSDNDKFH